MIARNKILISSVALLSLVLPANADDAGTEASGGEVLYNGIQLPTKWPPSDITKTGSDPLPVPYLENPPTVIPIDVGRQLFVDDFLIEWTDLTRTFHRPHKYAGNPVLEPETELELNATRTAPSRQGKPGNAAATPKSGGVWWDPDDQQFKMWYEAGWINTIALAVSDDGIFWERPEFDVRPGTNQVLPVDMTPDSWTVMRNWDSDDPQQKWTLYVQPPGKDQPGTSLVSADGIHWTHRTPTGKTGDRSTHFYNPFRKKWVYSLRAWPNKEIKRSREYYECDDFLKEASWRPADKVFWLRTDQNDLPDPEIGQPPQLYNFDAIAYESLMLGMFEIHRGPPNQVGAETGLPKITDLEFAYSRDGFHFDRPDRHAAIASERKDVWDHGYVQSVGGVCVIVGDELWFYYSAYRGNPDKADRHWHEAGNYDQGATGIAILRRDGFASMDAKDSTGTLTTRPVLFSGKHLFVNLDAPEGSLRVSVLDAEGNVIAPFSIDNCVPLSGNHTLAEVSWKGGRDLSELAGRQLRFRFELSNGDLYAFWVSPDKTGRSDGYLAAGGPGYTGPTDTVGAEALSEGQTLEIE